ncbi:hypothetical protein [Photorhabdus laumondii]
MKANYATKEDIASVRIEVRGWFTVPIGLISSYAAYKYKNPIIKIICTLIALVFLIPVIAALLGSMGLVEF